MSRAALASLLHRLAEFYRRWTADPSALPPEVEAPPVIAHVSGSDVFQRDVRDLLDALGLGTHARPYSAHDVIHRDVLPAITALVRITASTHRGPWPPPRRECDHDNGVCHYPWHLRDTRNCRCEELGADQREHIDGQCIPRYIVGS